MNKIGFLVGYGTLFSPNHFAALLGQNSLFCSDQLTVFPEQESIIDIRSTLEQNHFSALLGQNSLFCSDQLTVIPEQESLIDIRSTLEQNHFSALLGQNE